MPPPSRREAEELVARIVADLARQDPATPPEPYHIQLEKARQPEREAERQSRERRNETLHQTLRIAAVMIFVLIVFFGGGKTNPELAERIIEMTLGFIAGYGLKAAGDKKGGS